MKITGIVAEYNPFHNGHAYQIKKAREVTGCDYCIAVISGDFVQREKWLFSVNSCVQRWHFCAAQTWSLRSLPSLQ